jgi:signal transduction histidine kinase
MTRRLGADRSVAGVRQGKDRRIAARTADYALIAVATLLQVAGASTGGGRALGVAAGLLVGGLGLLQGLLLLVRRRRRAAVVAVCLVYAAQAFVGGALLPAAPWVALVRLTAASGATRALAAALLLLAAGMGLGSVSRPASAGGVPLLAAVTAAMVLTGGLVSARRARAEALAGRRAEAQQRLASQERLALARELHDSIGHGLSTIAVQSSAARMALDAGQTETARRALSAVESGSRAAMRDMRDLVSVLRGPEADLAPAVGLADLPAVVERIRQAGVAARLEVAPGLEVLSSGTQATVYRIVQEGLTNVVRHAPGAWAEASVTVEGEQVVVCIEDGGTRQPSPVVAVEPSGGSGYGLAGLRERVHLVGGTLEAGPTVPGWRLTARLPVTVQEAR